MSIAYTEKPDVACASLDQHLRSWAWSLVPDRCESGDATVNHCSWLVSVKLLGLQMLLGLFLSPQRFFAVPRLGGAADSYLAFGLGLCTKNMWSLGGQQNDDDKQRLFLELGQPSPFDRFIRSCRSFPQSKMMAELILFVVLRRYSVQAMPFD
jgi:hypothetical protein